MNLLPFSRQNGRCRRRLFGAQRSILYAFLEGCKLKLRVWLDYIQLRRGRPVAHKIFGIPQTINCANYVYFLAYQQLALLQQRQDAAAQASDEGSRSANLLEIVNEELLNLHRGQGMDLYWRDSLTCPTEREYIEMVSNSMCRRQASLP